MTLNDLEHYKVKGIPYMCHYYPWILNFSPFHSMASNVWVTGHFRTDAPNDPNMTLNTIRSKLSHIYVTSVTESSHFLAAGHFVSSAPNDPKNAIEAYKVKCTHIRVTSLPEYEICSIYDQPFPSYRSFGDKCTEWSAKWPIIENRSMIDNWK